MRNSKIPTILEREYIDVVIDERVNNKDFERFDTEIQTYECLEELRYPQKHENDAIIILNDFFEKEMEVPAVQAMFKTIRE